MEAYYSNQAALPHFSGYYRQRGSGFGALAAGVGRFALPLAKKYLLPVAKSVGRELIKQAVPELLDVVTKRKSPKQAARSAMTNTLRKQMGGGRKQSKRGSVTKRKQVQSKRKTKRFKRSRLDFFSKVKRNDR